MSGGVTANYGLQKPDFNSKPWDAKINGNFDLIDSILFAITQVPNIAGSWQNSTAYTAGQNVLDPQNLQFYQCLVSHTSAPTGTFAAARIANPSYWGQVTQNYVRSDPVSYSSSIQRQIRDNIGARRWGGVIAAATTMLPTGLNSVITMYGDGYSVFLPDIADALPGDGCEFINIAAGYITLQPHSGNTAKFISLAGTNASYLVGPGESAFCVTDGTNWLVGYRAKPSERTVDKAGDTMSGDLTIAKTGPGISFNYPGVRNYYLHTRDDGRFYAYESISANYPMSFGVAGDITTLQLGDLKTYIDKAPRTDVAQTFSDTALRQFQQNANLLQPVMQCVLFASSSTTLVLGPLAGNRVTVGRLLRQLTNIQLSNAGLAANTTYYIILYWTGTALALTYTTTPPAMSPNTGLLVNAGDDNQVVVGVAATDGASQFIDGQGARGTFSYFNKKMKNITGADVSGSVGTTFAEPNSAGRVYFYTDGTEAVELGIAGSMTPSTFDACQWYLTIDGAQIGRTMAVTLGGSGASANITHKIRRYLSPGFHYVSMAAKTNGSSATVAYQVEGSVNG